MPRYGGYGTSEKIEELKDAVHKIQEQKTKEGVLRDKVLEPPGKESPAEKTGVETLKDAIHKMGIDPT